MACISFNARFISTCPPYWKPLEVPGVTRDPSQGFPVNLGFSGQRSVHFRGPRFPARDHKITGFPLKPIASFSRHWIPCTKDFYLWGNMYILTAKQVSNMIYWAKVLWRNSNKRNKPQECGICCGLICSGRFPTDEKDRRHFWQFHQSSGWLSFPQVLRIYFCGPTAVCPHVRSLRRHLRLHW